MKLSFFASTFSANASNALGKILAFALLNRVLGFESFAEFMLILVVLEMAATILDFGGTISVIVNARKFASQGQFIRGLYFSKLIWFGVGFSLFAFILQDFSALLLLPIMLVDIENASLEGRYRFMSVSIRQFFVAVSRCLFIFLFFHIYSQNEPEVFIILFMFYAPLIILFFLDIIKNFIKSRHLFSWSFLTRKSVKLIYKTAIWQRSFWIMQIIVTWLRRGDIFFVAFFLGEEISGLFAALFTIVNVMPMVNSAIMRVLLPSVMDNKTIYQFLLNNKWKILSVSTIGAFFIALIGFFAYINIYTPESQVETSVALIIFFAVAINFPFQALSMPLYRINKVSVKTIIHFEQVFIQALFSTLLILSFDLLGAALSVLIVRIFGLVRLTSKMRNIT